MKTKLFYVFVVVTLLFGVVGCAAQEEEREADYYEFVPQTPVTPSTPEPEEPWYQGLLDCGPVGVVVEEFQGDLWGVDQFFRELGTPDVAVEQYRTYFSNGKSQYSVWRYYYLRETEFRPEDALYRQEWSAEQLLPPVRVSSLDEVPLSKRIKVWGRNGIIAEGTSGHDMEETSPLLCEPDMVPDGVSFAYPSALAYRTSFEVTNEDGRVLEAIFYKGWELDDWDLGHLAIVSFYDEATKPHRLPARAVVSSWLGVKYGNQWVNELRYLPFDLMGDADLYYKDPDTEKFVFHVEEDVEYVVVLRMTYQSGEEEIMTGRFVVTTPYANPEYEAFINVFEPVELPEDALTRLDDR